MDKSFAEKVLAVANRQGIISPWDLEARSCESNRVESVPGERAGAEEFGELEEVGEAVAGFLLRVIEAAEAESNEVEPERTVEKGATARCRAGSRKERLLQRPVTAH